MKNENDMSTAKFIYDIENGTVLAADPARHNGGVNAIDGTWFDYVDQDDMWMWVPYDLDAVHIEINGERMSLAALVTANSQDGCDPLSYELVLQIEDLPVGESSFGKSHDELITRIAPPREVHFVARKRDGHDRYDMKGFVWFSKEVAIGDLYTKWQMWMDDDFIHNVPGEVLQEADGDEVNPAIIAGGGTRLVSCWQ